MVDVDQKMMFQALQPCALHAVTFQNNGGFVFAVDVGSVNDGVRERQRFVDDRDIVTQHDFNALAHFAQDFRERQHGANGVPVRAGM